MNIDIANFGINYIINKQGESHDSIAATRSFNP